MRIRVINWHIKIFNISTKQQSTYYYLFYFFIMPIDNMDHSTLGALAVGGAAAGFILYKMYNSRKAAKYNQIQKICLYQYY